MACSGVTGRAAGCDWALPAALTAVAVTGEVLPWTFIQPHQSCAIKPGPSQRSLYRIPLLSQVKAEHDCTGQLSAWSIRGASDCGRDGEGCPIISLPSPCRMDLPDPAGPAALPKHILDVWVIVLIILATILIMTALVLCPATAVIIYRVRTHPTRNGIV